MRNNRRLGGRSRPAAPPAGASGAARTTRASGGSEEWIFSVSSYAAEDGVELRHSLSSRDGAWTAPYELNVAAVEEGTDTPTNSKRLAKVRSPTIDTELLEEDPTEVPEDLLEEGDDGDAVGPPSPKESAPLVGTRNATTQTTAKRPASARRLGAATVPLEPGWTFASPYWTLHSDVLLSVTYFPAWQALPAFTNAAACACCHSESSVWSMLRRGAGGAPTGGCCGSSLEDRIDYTCRQYTVRDVVAVETMEEYGEIYGMGTCAALKVYLPNLPLLEEPLARVPPHLRAAWQRARKNMEANAAVRQQRQRQPGGSAASGTDRRMSPPQTKDSNISETTMDEDENDSGSSLESCICLVFALPMDGPVDDTDPPLLWRVEFPALQDYALETLTILDGRLSTRPPSLSIPPPTTSEATHIYINGYQSWSFAGSIPRGHPQPTSALPDVFSRAFNYGASCPPAAPVVVDDNEGAAVESDFRSTLKQTSPPFQKFYQSDFFTCITSDVPVPNTKRRQFRNLVRETAKQNLQTIKETLSHANLGTLKETLSRANLAKGLSRANLMAATGGGPTAEPKDADVITIDVATANASLKNSNIPYQQLDETGGPALLVGWLSNRKQFGVIAVDQELERLQMHLSGHGQVFIAEDDTSFKHCTDWAYAQLIAPHSYDEEPMVHFLHHVATHNRARPLQNGNLLTGWCSWYFAYENISAQLLRDNFSKMSVLRTTVPTNVSVVDDGYMTAWGDWDSVKANDFPQGMEAVSRDISQFGMRPGLWMAPFAADKHSKITKKHPEWVIRNHAGAAANSSNCGKWFYGLDATNPAVRDYVHLCVQRAVKQWGFNVLKIDFLYAACLEGNGKFDLSMNRAEAMDLALQTIRHAAGPDAYLIGCGCPIATAIGFVDAMRVSADTGPTWYPARPLPYWDNGTLPSLRAMLRNSVARAPFGHRWWHNDPDCLMFGDHTRLSDDEIASAASVVAMTCGMLLLSDNLPQVPAHRMRILSKIFPLTGVSAVVLDLHSTNGGIPSLLRSWCTDKYGALDRFRKDEFIVEVPMAKRDYNAAATYFARQASFQPDASIAPEERRRSCIHVTSGLGTWTVVCISNWLDRPDVVHIPPFALLPPPAHGWGTSEDSEETELSEHGYHVFAFWSSKYSWLPQMKISSDGQLHSSDQTISKYLNAHATEIFHIKPVTPEWPQYIGSDFHFSCGQEVLSFRASSRNLRLKLGTELQRSGRIFVFVPRVNIDKNVRVRVAGEPGRWNTVGNTPKTNMLGHPHSLLGRIISIMVVVRADKSPKDGEVEIEF